MDIRICFHCTAIQSYTTRHSGTNTHGLHDSSGVCNHSGHTKNDYSVPTTDCPIFDRIIPHVCHSCGCSMCHPNAYVGHNTTNVLYSHVAEFLLLCFFFSFSLLFSSLRTYVYKCVLTSIKSPNPGHAQTHTHNAYARIYRNVHVRVNGTRARFARPFAFRKPRIHHRD